MFSGMCRPPTSGIGALWGAARTAVVALGFSTSVAAGQPDPSGIDFVTIGAPGNAAWAGGVDAPSPRWIGRGSVNYEYRIGRYEVTTAQWVEFFNAAYDRPANDRLPHLIPPDRWGAVETTPNTPGGRRWVVPAGREMVPVGTISWRMAAMYCNFLCNNKSTERSSFLNGAYDVSTFGYRGDVFTDQFTHNPGAQYWIPTLDEWFKASHYDPNKANPDGTLGGWWKYSNGSDTPFNYGPPGVHVIPGGIGRLPAPDPNGPLATANAGWNYQNFPGYSPFAVPLGSYAVTSPWGLYDVAGATSEWLEEVGFAQNLPQYPEARYFAGSAWASDSSDILDRFGVFGGDFPSLSTYDLGFRIASTVPAPPWVLAMACSVLAARRQRRDVEQPGECSTQGAQA